MDSSDNEARFAKKVWWEFIQQRQQGECDSWWWGTNRDGSRDPITEEAVIKETVLTPSFKLEAQGQWN